MRHGILPVLLLMLLAASLAGCTIRIIPDTPFGPATVQDATEPTVEQPTGEPTVPETTVPATTLPATTVPAFEPYLLKIKSKCVPIYSGPGYDFKFNRTIEDKGVYTIVEENGGYDINGQRAIWGRLKSGAGWICIDDAKDSTFQFVRCVECGKYLHHAGKVHGTQLACNDCFNVYCTVCGADCTYRGVEANGMCEDCYAAEQKMQETAPSETAG